MRELCFMAVRNVWRHPRRSLLTCTAVTLGVAIMVIADGFVEFTFQGLEQSVVYGGLGHVQVLGEDEHPRARLDEGLVLELVQGLRSDARIGWLATRVGFEGLASAPGGTVAVSGVGVEAAAESKIRSLIVLRSGEWFLGSERTPKALLGYGLARRLGVKTRDVISVIAYSDSGRMTAVDVGVAGIFESGVIEYDARSILIPLESARLLMETRGATAIVATVRDVRDVEGIAERLSVAVQRSTHGARVLTWRELSPVYSSVVALYRWILRAFLGVLTLAVVLGVANTMTMAVLERIPEVGILRAIGFGRMRVVALFVIEALAIGLLGSLGGVVLGVTASQLLTWLAIEMPPPPGHSQGYLLEVAVAESALLASVAGAVVSALLAGFFPSLRAIRGEVADALRC